MLDQSVPRQKLLAAMFMLLSLKSVAIAIIVSTFLLAALSFFVVALDALTELCMHVSQVWNASTPIERLLIFVIAWVLIYKLTPVLVKLCKIGKVF